MSFMYLELYTENDKLIARVTKKASVSSLGTETSRWADSPVAIFQIDSFNGFENVTDDELWDLLRERDIFNRLEQQFLHGMETVQLFEELKLRMERLKSAR